MSEGMAQRIRELRKAKKLTLEQVARVVGVEKSTVRKWETGMIANMRWDKIASLARALGTTPTYLMGSKAEQSAPAEIASPPAWDVPEEECYSMEGDTNMTIGFIGTGNMGGALARAAAKAVSPGSIYLANRTAAKAQALAAQIGAAATDNDSVAVECDYIFLGVKPQMMPGLLDSLRLLQPDHLPDGVDGEAGGHTDQHAGGLARGQQQTQGVQQTGHHLGLHA